MAGSANRRFFGGASSRSPVPYPDPWVDIAQFNIPPSVKSLMILCRRIFLTHSTIYPTVWKYSNYPITDIRVEAATENIKADWLHYFNSVLKLKRFDQMMGLDFFTYGNAIASIVFPTDKYLICPECNYETKAKSPSAQYRFNKTGDWDYRGNCPACRRMVIYLVEDRQVKHAFNRVRLIRWPPLSIDIDYNPYTDDRIYFHRIPRVIKDKLAAGSKLLSATLSKEFIRAAKRGKRIKLENDNLYHMARPSISDSRLSFSPWGLPLILPVVKDAFWMQILKKQEEAMAQNRINSLRMLFPTEGNQPVMAGMNLGMNKAHLEREVRKWIRDPNYIGIAPFAISSTTLGADMKPMLLAGEIKNAAEIIVTGMGVPREFIYGGLQYTGTSISIRMVENDMISYRGGINDFNEFVRRRSQVYLEWPACKTKLSSLRLADDVQMKQFVANLHAAGKVSDDTFLQELNLNADVERKKRREEFEKETEMMKLQAQAQAESQGMAGLISSRYQFEAQRAMQEAQGQYADMFGGNAMEGQPGQPGMDPGGMGMDPTDQEAMEGSLEQGSGEQPSMESMLEQHVQELSNMEPQERAATLEDVKSTNPTYASVLIQRMGAEGAMSPVDTRPLPEQRPPTRANSPI